MFAGIDHDRAVSDLSRRVVQAAVGGDVFVQLGGAERRPPAGHRLLLGEEPGQNGDAPGAVHPGPEREHPASLLLGPSAERALADLAPEGAGGKQLATPARLVRQHASGPEVDDLTERRDAGDLAEETLQQSGPATAKAAQENHPRRGWTIRHRHESLPDGYGTCRG